MELKEVAEILKAVAWPLVVGTIFIMLCDNIRDICAVFSAKIARASRLKVSRTGLEIIEEIVRQSFAPGGITEAETKPQSRAEFDNLAAKFNELSDPDYKSRVAKRTDMADRLGRLALGLKLSRADLAESQNEGELVAFATVAIVEPKPTDLVH